MIHIVIHKLSYVLGIAICLTLILWSYIEEDFYSNYIQGEWFLIWTVYIFPWVIIGVTIWHYLTNRER